MNTTISCAILKTHTTVRTVLKTRVTPTASARVASRIAGLTFIVEVNDMEIKSKTVFDGEKFTIDFGNADVEQLEEGFLTSVVLSSLAINTELSDLTPEMALAHTVLQISACEHFDFEKFCVAMDYLTGDDDYEKAN